MSPGVKKAWHWLGFTVVLLIVVAIVLGVTGLWTPQLPSTQYGTGAGQGAPPPNPATTRRVLRTVTERVITTDDACVGGDYVTNPHTNAPMCVK